MHPRGMLAVGHENRVSRCLVLGKNGSRNRYRRDEVGGHGRGRAPVAPLASADDDVQDAAGDVLPGEARTRVAEPGQRVAQREPVDVEHVGVGDAHLLQREVEEEVLLVGRGLPNGVLLRGAGEEADLVAAGPARGDLDAEAVVAEAAEEIEDAVLEEGVLDALGGVVAEEARAARAADAEGLLDVRHVEVAVVAAEVALAEIGGDGGVARGEGIVATAG